ncbi:MAG: adenylyltransferase/cytidyltransferase family protein [Candidatus Latescibacterota bacterium]|nr:MAG: adenylyltransferase/cytidyltransferase family protein [Candidatus Latescibacterota bacterium]
MRHKPAPVFRSMAKLREWLAKKGAERIVLANGCFDPLHVGHIRYLRGAKAHGDVLVVALNNDASTNALKGEGRPVVKAADRSKVLAGFEMVDAVLIFAARNVSRILKTLQPHYHAKGTDYTVDTVPELETSRKLGIHTVIVGDPKSHASSEVVTRIRNGGVDADPEGTPD